ncbi:MAG: TolC family protein [Colwellia sp.]|nr:TolC family protein [Colwellia sp.]
MFTLKKQFKRHKLGALSLLSLACFTAYADNNSLSTVKNVAALTFAKAIKVAQTNDPWLTGNRYKQSAIVSMSKVANTLPDPKISIAMANVPIDGYDLNQEGMTQFKVGITQMFPRGDTLAIKNEQLLKASQAYPFQRQDRQAKVAVTVGQLWLDAFRIQQTIALIEKDRSLFEQLADVAQASYSSAIGKTRQQDLVRAQLELTRLDERLDLLGQKKNNLEGQLLQWISDYSGDVTAQNNITINSMALHGMNLGKNLPTIDLLKSDLIFSQHWQQAEELIPYFNRHPAVIAVDKKIAATKTGIKLAEQKYQPEWGVTASYGYRGDDPMGRSRADLFSAGVTFDLPLFTENRQDQEVKAAVYQTEAVKTEKLLLLRQLLGAYSKGKGRLLRLNDRQKLYREILLVQSHDQAEASLTAYTNDDGDFAEVVRARIAVLNAEIEALNIDTEQQKIYLELNYLFIGELVLSQQSFAKKGN